LNERCIREKTTLLPFIRPLATPIIPCYSSLAYLVERRGGLLTILTRKAPSCFLTIEIFIPLIMEEFQCSPKIKSNSLLKQSFRGLEQGSFFLPMTKNFLLSWRLALKTDSSGGRKRLKGFHGNHRLSNGTYIITQELGKKS
jgi:hypothetical protein